MKYVTSTILTAIIKSIILLEQNLSAIAFGLRKRPDRDHDRPLQEPDDGAWQGPETTPKCHLAVPGSRRFPPQRRVHMHGEDSDTQKEQTE